LEQLDRVPVRVKQLHLLPSRAAYDIAPELHATLVKSRHDRREIVHREDETIPSTRMLLAVRQRTRSRAPGSAQEEIDAVT